jgi:hypothetical protein
MPPPITTRPSSRVIASAIASPATSPSRRNASWAASRLPSADPSAMAKISLGCGACSNGMPVGRRVNAPHRANGGAFLGVAVAVELMPQEPDFAGRRVIADNQLSVAHQAAAESRAQRDAQQIAKSLGTAGLFEQSVDVREESGRGFAVREQVAIVIDESRQSEGVFQDGRERHVAIRRQVARVDHDAAEVIARAGKAKLMAAGGSGAIPSRGESRR